MGVKYSDELLVPLDKNALETNWWEALKFFFDHSFARGRSDELSIQYINFTISALKEYFNINSGNIEESYNDLKKMPNILTVRILLNLELKKGRKLHKSPRI